MKVRLRSRRSLPSRLSSHRPWRLDGVVKWIVEQRILALFLAKFVVILAGLYAISLAPWFNRVIPGYLHLVAWGANGLAHLCGEPSQVAGTTLYTGAFGVTVSPDCSALGILGFIVAVVLAFPASWSARAWGLFLGASLCALLNILRVASLLWVGVHARKAFDLAHEQVWAILLVVFATLFVAAWLHWFASNDSPSTEQDHRHASA